MSGRRIGLCLLLLMTVAFSGCKKPIPEPDYGRPLPEGAFGLRRIMDQSQWPDLTPVIRQLTDSNFRGAAERSLRWYGYPSSKAYFPSGPISLAHAQASMYALLNLPQDAAGAEATIRSDFDIWESVGWDGSGVVLFTGYYTPIFRGSRSRTAEYKYPIYQRPPDLVSDPVTGETRGRQTSAGIVPYPTRAQIENSRMLAGRELVYLASRLDAYVVEVNGSAKFQMTDGSTMYVGYAGTNGHEYTSVGGQLVKDGKLSANRVSLPAIREYFLAHPNELDDYIRRNDRFIFFREYTGDNWPAGSLGFRATSMRTLATDKAIFPRGCAVLVNTRVPSGLGDRQFDQLMLDQDTGGAIRAAGRADIYMGIGPDAERSAGRQSTEGRMYYLLLKPEKVVDWYNRMSMDAKTK